MTFTFSSLDLCFHTRRFLTQNSRLTVSTVKEKAQHAVVLDKATSDKLQKEVQSYRLITVSILVDRLKINGSLARRALADLEEKGTIKKVVGHSKMSIYSTWRIPSKKLQSLACLRIQTLLILCSERRCCYS